MSFRICRTRIFPIICLCLSLAFSWYSNAAAEVKLVKLDDWSGLTLVDPTDVFVKPGDTHLSSHVASWTHSEVLVARLGSGTSPFRLIMGSETDSILAVVLGDFTGARSMQMAVLIENQQDRMLDTLHDYAGGSLTYRLLLYDLESQIAIDSSLFSLDIYLSLIWNQIWQSYPITLRAGDYNHDGKDNLMLSIGWIKNVCFCGGVWLWDETVGFTTIWDSFPKDTLLAWKYPVADFGVVDSTHLFARYLIRKFRESHGTPPSYSVGRLIDILDPTFTPRSLPSVVFGNDACGSLHFSNADQFTKTIVLKSMFSQGASEPEFLLSQYRTDGCETASQWALVSPDDSGNYITTWQRRLLGNSPVSHGLVRDESEKSFFAFGESEMRLYEFEGVTGDVIDSTLGRLAGRLVGWYDLFGDGNKYLVTLNNTLVEAYGFDFVTDVSDEKTTLLPETFKLSNPYPNPFNPEVSFAVALPARSDVTIVVYNILGETVDELFSGTLGSGETSFSWNADRYASGVYLIRASAGESQTRIRKVMLLK